MCGILAIIQSTKSEKKIRKLALSLSGKLRHRGPDWNGMYAYFIVGSELYNWSQQTCLLS